MINISKDKVEKILQWLYGFALLLWIVQTACVFSLLCILVNHKQDAAIARQISGNILCYELGKCLRNDDVIDGIEIIFKSFL